MVQKKKNRRLVIFIFCRITVGLSWWIHQCWEVTRLEYKQQIQIHGNLKTKYSEEQSVQADDLCYWPRELVGDTRSSRDTTKMMMMMIIIMLTIMMRITVMMTMFAIMMMITVMMRLSMIIPSPSLSGTLLPPCGLLLPWVFHTIHCTIMVHWNASVSICCIVDFTIPNNELYLT